MMDLNRKYSDAELEKIVDEAAIYMCACPGQVANEIRQLRQLIRYQGECIVEARTPKAVHETIAASAHQAHAIMEACLDRVLELEGWDRTTLQMPPGLRKLRDEVIQRST
ncbi:hypothetical protein [Niveibacterium sp.]|uniref:hypothetical protein n=1 Tax=Niveibacterium sp. TaxID=2017444 RepID=UPI0035B314A0